MAAVFTRASTLADELGLSVASIKRLIRSGKLEYFPDRAGDYILPGEAILKLRAVMMQTKRASDRARAASKAKTRRAKAKTGAKPVAMKGAASAKA